MLGRDHRRHLTPPQRPIEVCYQQTRGDGPLRIFIYVAVRRYQFIYKNFDEEPWCTRDARLLTDKQRLSIKKQLSLRSS